MLFREGALQEIPRSEVQKPALAKIYWGDADEKEAVHNVLPKQDIKNGLKQNLFDMVSSRKGNFRDTFFERLRYTAFVFRFVARREEHMKEKKSQLLKTKKELLQNIQDMDKVDM